MSLRVQRAPDDGGAPPPTGAAATPATAPGVLLVDDTAQPLSGQMRRSEFLARLREAVSVTAQEALSGTPWSAVGCPWIDHWFGYYAGRDAAQIERALRSYAPSASSAATAAAAIPLVCARVRSAIAAWSTTGAAPSGAPGDASGATADGDMVQRKESSAGAGALVSPEAVRNRLTDGSPLPSTIRGRMESAFGHDFSPVRVHSDAGAASLASHLSAQAFTVGTDIAFAAGKFQPDTLAGDALLAHELAHVVQQRAGAAGPQPWSDGGDRGLEEEADRAAAGALAGAFGGREQADSLFAGGMPSLARGGLRLQRCKEPKKASLFEELGQSDSAADLASRLGSGDVTDAQLTELDRQASAGSALAEAVQWERAMRRRDFAALARLSQSSTRSFYQAYSARIVALVTQGRTCLRIVDKPPGYAAQVSAQLDQLASGGPTGFRLIVSLLAAGQTVTISQTSGENETNAVTTEANPDAGRFVSSGPDSTPLPLSAQHRGATTGSTIAYNPAATGQVTVGGTAGHLQIIDLDESLILGHELIHALHNARGENIAPPPLAKLALAAGRPMYQVGNPATNDYESAEELRTITGATSFTPPPTYTPTTTNWALRYNLPDDGLNENALRRERGLPDRVSHRGAQRAIGRNMPKGTTLDALLGRYSMANGGPVPQALRGPLRDVLIQMNPWFADPAHTSLPVDFPVNFPHGQYMALYLAFVAGQTDLAETAKDLRVQ